MLVYLHPITWGIKTQIGTYYNLDAHFYKYIDHEEGASGELMTPRPKEYFS